MAKVERFVKSLPRHRADVAATVHFRHEPKKRSALILWGSWPGHVPQQGAKIVAAIVIDHGFALIVTSDDTALSLAG